MQFKRASLFFALSVITVFRAPAAFADTPALATSPWYVGASIGYSTIKPKVSGYNTNVLTYSEKTSDIGFKIFGGYQFDQNWAVEAQYIDLGKYKIDETGTSDNAHATAKVSGVAVNAVGTLPLNEQISLIAKLGVVYGTLKADVFDSVDRSSYKVSKTAPLMGFGAEYKFSPQIALRAEYEFYGSPTVFGTSRGNIKFRSDMFSLGLLYRF